MRHAQSAQPQTHLKPRLNKVYDRLDGLKLDGLLITNQANIAYLTGFLSRESYLLLSRKGNFFITDFRYIEEARKNIKNAQLKTINGSAFDVLGNSCMGLGLRQLGFEAKNLVFAEHTELKKRFKKRTDLTPTYDLVGSFRQRKTKDELKKIQRAVEITANALEYTKGIIKVGMRESDLRPLLERYIINNGASSFSFDIIIASGTNSSYPHHITSLNKINRDELVLIDMGVTFEGYKSDLTRVFFLGKIAPIIKRIYNIILKAQEAAIKYIRPGVPISKVDAIARQYITQRGYGSFFGHNLGHGIGLEVHEEPHVSPKNNNRLEAGMVFTVEPAIYLTDNFGIRIEDMVLVTNQGVKVLSGGLDKSIKNWIDYTSR